MHKKNRGEKIGKRVRFSARELMIATNRRTDDKSYKRLEAAFQRLVGTTFTTNIANGDYEETASRKGTFACAAPLSGEYMR